MPQKHSSIHLHLSSGMTFHFAELPLTTHLDFCQNATQQRKDINKPNCCCIMAIPSVSARPEPVLDLQIKESVVQMFSSRAAQKCRTQIHEVRPRHSCFMSPAFLLVHRLTAPWPTTHLPESVQGTRLARHRRLCLVSTHECKRTI